MKNIWTETSRTNRRMDEEDAILQACSGDELAERITEIVEATLDEFWRPEAFTDSEDYCSHMMHYKPMLIPYNVIHTIKGKPTFKSIMLAILNNIEFFNSIYTDLFYNGELIVYGADPIKCNCPVCK